MLVKMVSSDGNKDNQVQSGRMVTIFVDSSMQCLKAMLLDKGNIMPSIPIACTNHKKDKYENVKEILSCVNYKTFQWHIYGDLKVTAVLMGLQKGYKRIPLFPTRM